MTLDADHCYAIVRARDPRWDGLFFVGVSTTGVYCRPICTVRTPGRDRCSFFPTPASAEAAGYRPCLRCRPELAPGRAPVDAVRQMAREVVSHIDAGALRSGRSEALAGRIGLSSRQVRRIVRTEFGVTPAAIARTRRLLLAKQLLTDTELRVADVAFASGFSSVRQFNRLFAQAYRLKPAQLRRQRAGAPEAGIPLKLGFRPPLAWDTLVEFLVRRGSARTAQRQGDRYTRTVRIGARTGWISARPAGERLLQVDVSPSLLTVLPELQARVRRLFDLDASPSVIDAQLRRDPRLRALVRRTPGLRVAGTLDGFELALRAVLGQQVSVAAATTLFGRFVDAFGQAIETPWPGLDRLAPTAAAVSGATVQELAGLGLTGRRAETIRMLAQRVVSGALVLDPPVDVAEARRQLQDVPGIGPWTVEYIAMRALGDPDAFPHSDLGLLRALGAQVPAALLAQSDAWRPWRAYVAMHAWNGPSSGGG